MKKLTFFFLPGDYYIPGIPSVVGKVNTDRFRRYGFRDGVGSEGEEQGGIESTPPPPHHGTST